MVKTIGEIFDLFAGGDVDKSNFSPVKDAKHPYPVYSNALQNEGLYGYTAIPRYKGDSITITGRGSVGTPMYRANDFDAIIRLLVLTPKNDNVCAKYISAYMQQCIVFPQESTGVPQLTVPQIRDIELSLPPLSEQKGITTVLSDMDAYIAILEKLVSKKHAVKQGAMQELLTGKRRLPGFSGEWVEKPLDKVALDIRTGKKNNEDKIPNGKYPFFVRSQQIVAIDSWSYDGEAIVIPGEGNIGDIFHYIVGKFDFHQRVYKVSDFAPDCDGKYVYYQMRMSFGKHALENTSKATVDSLRLPVFKEFIVNLPPTKEEQTAIAELVTDMDKELDALTTKLVKARQIKLGMMHELLTGNIRLIEEGIDNGEN
jgi:type I restriction enzyme S subunit